MYIKASRERDNSDFYGVKMELTPFGEGLTVKLTLENGNEIEVNLDKVSKRDITADYWFGFEYEGYAFDGELFYADDDPESDIIALNIYDTIEDENPDPENPEPGSDVGVCIGDDLGIYAECECRLD